MRCLRLPRLARGLLLGVLAGILGLVLSLFPFGLALEENVGLGLLFRLRGARQAPRDVVVVSVEKESADYLGLPSRPDKWPRAFHSRLVERLVKAGASVIVFDIFFDEARSADQDAAFAAAIRKAGNVVLFESLRRETIRVPARGAPRAAEVNIETLVPPVAPLSEAAASLAPFPLPKVPVKVSQYWAFKTGAGDTPTLPVVAFQLSALDVYDDFRRLLEKVSPSHAGKLPPDPSAILAAAAAERFVRVVREIFQAEPRVAERMLEEIRSPGGDAPGGEKRRKLVSLVKMYQAGESLYLNFYGPAGTIPTVPYHRALEPDLPGAARIDLAGKAVFVGLSERFRTDQKDGFHTVFSESSGLDLSGVEIAATAFGNLADDTPVRPLGLTGHVLTLLLWGMAMGILCGLSPARVGAAGAVGAGVLYVLGAQSRFTSAGEWYPLVHPLLVQVPFAFFGALLWKYVETDTERKEIRRVLGYYLPGDAVVERVLKDVAGTSLSSEVVYGTCLATDVEQFTLLGEKMDPAELGQLINSYFPAVLEPVTRNGGFVSDIIGDSAVAVWAAAQPDVALRRRASLAACDILVAVDRFNRAIEEKKNVKLPTRIGLHSGRMSLGNVGAAGHYEYRAVGDPVNSATRIQGLNKRLGTRILASGEALEGLDGFLAREIGTFVLAGKSKSLVIHELICRDEEANPEQRELCLIFAEALRAYRNRSWEEAIRRYQESIRRAGEDGPSLFYVEQCEAYKKAPPDDAWSGVVHMDRK